MIMLWAGNGAAELQLLDSGEKRTSTVGVALEAGQRNTEGHKGRAASIGKEVLTLDVSQISW